MDEGKESPRARVQSTTELIQAAAVELRSRGSEEAERESHPRRLFTRAYSERLASYSCASVCAQLVC